MLLILMLKNMLTTAERWFQLAHLISNDFSNKLSVISQKVLKALGSLTPEFPIPVAEGDNKALNVDKDISIKVESSEISKDCPKENKLRRRKEAKLRKKLEGTKDVVKEHDEVDNNSQLNEASATKTSILSKYSEKLVNKDNIDAEGGEIVDIADVVKKDDGPGESDVELAKVAPLHCFPSGQQTWRGAGLNLPFELRPFKVTHVYIS